MVKGEPSLPTQYRAVSFMSRTLRGLLSSTMLEIVCRVTAPGDCTPARSEDHRGDSTAVWMVTPSSSMPTVTMRKKKKVIHWHCSPR